MRGDRLGRRLRSATDIGPAIAADAEEILKKVRSQSASSRRRKKRRQRRKTPRPH